MTEEVDKVEEVLEKPLWRSVQAKRYMIERREKQIKKLELEIEQLYQEVANLRAGCKPGDLIRYKSDENKVKFVEDVDFMDFSNSLVFVRDFHYDGYIDEELKQYPSSLIYKNYEVFCSYDSFTGF